VNAHARSFPPIEGERARVLILGSMPGVASLEAARYYAHPRNAFWPIVLALLGSPAVHPVDAGARRKAGTDHFTANDPGAPAPRIPYERRIARLVESGVALWDVLAECERPGSLDSAIRRGSERCNDVPALCARHPELALIAFNGQTAAKLYRRHLAGAVERERPDIALATLPSTSPAYAALDPATKRARWHEALRPFLSPSPHAPAGFARE